MNDRDYRPMLVGRLREASCFIVRSGDVGKEVARVLFTYDLEASQRNKERFADAESSCAVCVSEAVALGHFASHNLAT